MSTPWRVQDTNVSYCGLCTCMYLYSLITHHYLSLLLARQWVLALLSFITHTHTRRYTNRHTDTHTDTEYSGQSRVTRLGRDKIYLNLFKSIFPQYVVRRCTMQRKTRKDENKNETEILFLLYSLAFGSGSALALSLSLCIYRIAGFVKAN